MFGFTHTRRWAPAFRKKPERRLLWITSEYHPRIGGLEKLTEQLISALSDYADIGLVTGYGQFPKPGENVVHVGALNLKGCLTDSEFRFAGLELQSLCREFRPDVIHLACGGLACFAGLLSKIAPVFCTVHCKDVTAPWQRVPGADARAAIAAGLERCARVFCVSDYTGHHLSRIAPNALVETLTPGLPASFLAAKQCRRSYFTPPGGTPRILTVARLTRRKGHIQLLDALQAIDQPFIWDIVGDGPLWGELEAQIEQSSIAERIIMHGTLNDDQLGLVFQQCDMFALTPVEVAENEGGGLDAEGFGLVYLEAAAYRKPAVGSLIGGCREAIADGHTGFAIDPFERDKLTEALERLLQSLPLRQSMGDKALERLKSQFRVEDRAAVLAQRYGFEKLNPSNSKSLWSLLS
jgi:phosphatidylinositol alpha-1,6-mannosyltransferase